MFFFFVNNFDVTLQRVLEHTTNFLKNYNDFSRNMKQRQLLKVFGFAALMAGLQPLGLLAAEPEGSAGSDISAGGDMMLVSPTKSLRLVIVSGYASPDGPYALNARLAQQRADNLKAYVSQQYNVPLNKIETRAIAEDWDGLREYVEAASSEQLPNREALLEIIDSNREPDAKEELIRTKYAEEFGYLKENCIPQLRRSEYTVEYETEETTGDGQNEIAEVTSVNSAKKESKEVVVVEANPAKAAAHRAKMTVGQKDTKPVKDDSVRVAVISTSPFYSPRLRADQVIITDSTWHDSIQGQARIQYIINEWDLRPDSKDNSGELDRISATLDKIFNDSTIRVRTITICSYASPDGSYAFNDNLAKKRTESLKDFVVERYDLPLDVIKTTSVAEDWEGLEYMIAASTVQELPHRDQLLDLIHSDRGLDEKERIIRSRYAVDFNYMKDHILPPLRRSEYIIEYVKDNRYLVIGDVVQPDEPDIVDETIPEPIDTPVVVVPKNWYLAARTNLLYDAAVIPNIGLEVPLGKNWTLNADWFYTWFKNDDRHRYWQGYGGYFGVRKYFGAGSEENPFTGHHLGAYGLMMTYDVEFGGRGYQSPDWGFGGGIEYGYSMPIARRFNLDFSLGVGYQDGKYHEYLPMDGHYVWQSTHHRNWFGPTKAEVSLKWLIGRGNVHHKYDKKGGDL